MSVLEESKLNFRVFYLTILIFSVFFGLSLIYLRNQNQIKKLNFTSISPTSIKLNLTKKSVIPTNIATPQMTTVESVSETVKLKIAAIGGGAINIDIYDFIFTFNREPNDIVTILKRNESENNNYAGSSRDANDLGFVIKHGNITLKITPTFEGIGLPIKQKLTPVIISNTKLATGPIFRLRTVDFDEYQNSGSIYTTQYKDNPEDCVAWGANVGQPNPPACIWTGAQVFIKGEYALEIFCSAEGDEAIWCDNIVKSLTVSAVRRSN